MQRPAEQVPWPQQSLSLLHPAVQPPLTQTEPHVHSLLPAQESVQVRVEPQLAVVLLNAVLHAESEEHVHRPELVSQVSPERQSSSLSLHFSRQEPRSGCPR